MIVPYLRGYGTTRFLSPGTFRNGQQSVLAVDTVALMNALGIEKAVVAGADWGARAADSVAALWPQRCDGLVSVSGYLIGSQQAGELPLAPEAERQWWYQYYFATERGRAGYERYRREFARLIWRTASPQWDFDDATFERTAGSLDNPDHVAIVIHNCGTSRSMFSGHRGSLCRQACQKADLQQTIPRVRTGPTLESSLSSGQPAPDRPIPLARRARLHPDRPRSPAEHGCTHPRRAFGFHTASAVIALAMLSLADLCPPLPGR